MTGDDGTATTTHALEPLRADRVEALELGRLVRRAVAEYAAAARGRAARRALARAVEQPRHGRLIVPALRRAT